MNGFIDPLDRRNAMPELYFDPQDVADNRIVSAVAYWWILFFLPLVVNPQSHYGRFHANQGLILLITSLLCSASIMIPIAGILIAGIGNLICFILQIIGTVNALSGRGKRLPLIGEYELIR